MKNAKYLIVVAAALSCAGPGCGDIDSGGDADAAQYDCSFAMPPVTEGMTLVPAGDFIAGCDPDDYGDMDEECHESLILKVIAGTEAFYIDEYEVTNRDFVKFLNCNGNRCGDVACYAPFPVWTDQFQGTDARLLLTSGSWTVETGFENHPVVDITWDGARTFCEWRGKRLPTQLEWEKAARGTVGNRFPYGNSNDASYSSNGFLELLTAEPENRQEAIDSVLGSLADNGYLSAECQKFCADSFTGYTFPAGCFLNDISQFGIHDMGGNVEEIVEDDFFSESALGVSEEEFTTMVPLDGSAWVRNPRESRRVRKGGSVIYEHRMWDSNPVYADIRANPMWETWGADPLFTESAYGDFFIGFRCAADATE